VATEAVGFDLQQCWAFTRACAFYGLLHCFIDGDHIHAINLCARDVVGCGTWEQAIDGPGFLYGHTHRILVVFADIDNGQFPDRGEVEGLVEGSFINGSIAKETGSDAILPQILGGKGNTGGDGHLSSNNSVATED